ncbi:hypothetical protein DICPUDRAFT_150540 [Dictyostelium purpureum]|uniref:Uncharacterized protein n=1 Tax=Dictyostelium purpureum TaxID=5786 RepID=F0ZGK8_DICPU|nr:uncharacterized protein DICPUDRAFT_150540 [Dictyostelium purpureum]EGC36905.1 hypothetical protein DICPUDRAFT_150540 [Dictyostelium purpureum]|eukprot:XP_003286548.1 hypothetical protein DICPUDRAFT_150540 [Dictyostelium purpureum]
MNFDDDNISDGEGGTLYKTFSEGEREEKLKKKSNKKSKRTNTSSAKSTKKSRTSDGFKKTGLINLNDTDSSSTEDEPENIYDKKAPQLNKQKTTTTTTTTTSSTSSSSSSLIFKKNHSKFSNKSIFDDEIENSNDDEDIFNKNRDRINNERKEKNDDNNNHSNDKDNDNNDDKSNNNINNENKRNTNLDSAGIDKVKQAIHFSVAKISEEKSDELNCSISNEVVSSLSELVYSITKDIIAKDLITFARHAGRNTIETNDVKVLARRNEHLKDILDIKESERFGFND